MKKDLSGCDRRMNEKVQIGVQNLEVEQSENDMGQRFGEFLEPAGWLRRPACTPPAGWLWRPARYPT